MARPQKYKIDNNYFSSVMTPNKAYLLGLIYSDGSLSRKHGTLSYVCSKKDVEIVNFIKLELKSDHPIRYIKEDYVGFCISNKKIVDDLVKNFDLPEGNKSLNNLSVPNITIKYIPHFIRGIFDGDGSIWTDGSSYAYAFTGGRDFLLEIANIIHEATGLRMRLRYRHGESNPRACSIEVKGNKHASALYNYMYKNGMFLTRKHRKFLSAIELDKATRQLSKRFRDRERVIITLYNSGVRQFEIAKLLNCPGTSVRGIVQKNRRNGLVH